jgi:hypothetical protein
MKTSIQNIIKMIENEDVFTATAEDGSFTIKIEKYIPYFSIAIHAGHHFRDSLIDNCLLSEYDRRYEEDPKTDTFIENQSITMIAHDSRYEYDLNRDINACVYETAWGKTIWKKPLSSIEIEKSHKKYHNFYTVAYALIRKLEGKFSFCEIFNMHSYNYKRHDRTTPLFDMATDYLNHDIFGERLTQFQILLSQISIDGIENITTQNNVFTGGGNFLKSVTCDFSNTLVYAFEVKKIYCNELSGKLHPKLIKQLTDKIDKAINHQIRERNPKLISY